MSEHAAYLEMLEGLTDRATPGPWTRTGTDVWSYSVPKVIVHGKCETDEDHANVADQRFIAIAREAVPFLIRLVRELEAERDTWRQRCIDASARTVVAETVVAELEAEKAENAEAAEKVMAELLAPPQTAPPAVERDATDIMSREALVKLVHELRAKIASQS